LRRNGATRDCEGQSQQQQPDMAAPLHGRPLYSAGTRMGTA
jgi:hypothetical protein